MTFIVEALVSLLLVAGGFFTLVGSFGLVKLTDPVSRLHAPTKATTLGVGALLVASVVYAAAGAPPLSFHELLITVFLFLTAPVTAHFIAKAHIHRTVARRDLPEPSPDGEWATVARPPQEPD